MYLCNYCKKEFSTFRGQRTHESTCIKNPNRIDRSQSYSKVVCNICGKSVSKTQLTNHMKCHLNHINNLNGTYVREYYCSFCGKKYRDPGNTKKHELYHCELNPDRKPYKPKNSSRILSEESRKRMGWSKGLTKDTDARILNISNILREAYDSGRLTPTFKNKTHSKDTREKLSQIAKNNDYYKHFYKGQKFEYNGFKFQSSFEVKLAKELDKNNINWTKPEPLTYTDTNGKSHKYIPDFYLPSYNVYLDPKNDFLIENVNPYFGYYDTDKIKWVEQQNNVRILILNEQQLYWKYIKSMLEQNL